MSRGESAGVSIIIKGSSRFFEVPHNFDGVLPLDDGWSRRGGTRWEKCGVLFVSSTQRESRKMRRTVSAASKPRPSANDVVGVYIWSKEPIREVCRERRRRGKGGASNDEEEISRNDDDDDKGEILDGQSELDEYDR